MEADRWSLTRLGGTEDGEHIGIALVETDAILATQGDFSYGTPPFDEVYLTHDIWQFPKYDKR